MTRKARGARGRLASPAQIARLEALLKMRISQPVPFESYRHMMRSHMNPESNVDTELAAWEHLEKKDATLPPPWWPPVWKVSAPCGAPGCGPHR